MFICYRHGSKSIAVTKFIASIVKLLLSNVRDIAFNALVEFDKHIGEQLHMDLQLKSLIPTCKAGALLTRLDEVWDAGEMLPPAVASAVTVSFIT